MNNILRSVVIGTVINTARGYGKVALKAEFEWNWNMQNRCGPRPSGPKYPYPPDTNGSFVDPGNCDIIQDQTYIYNYECETSCQMDSSKMIKLTCHCLTQVGPIQKVEDCEWRYENDERCPDVPEEEQYDWECDPRSETCPPGQYPTPEGMAVGSNPFGLYSWQTQMANMGNGSFLGGGMPGYINHIYIQPVMNQQVHGGLETEETGHARSGGNTFHGHQLTFEEEAVYASQLAEAKERTRGYKSQIKNIENAFKRERTGYEAQIKEKEASRQELMDQLHVLQELVKFRVDHGDNPDFSSFFSLEDEKDTDDTFSGMLLDVSGAPLEPVDTDSSLSRDKVIQALEFDESKISKPERELSRIEQKRLEIKEKRRARRKERRQTRRLEKLNFNSESEEASGLEYDYIEYSDEEYDYYARGLGTTEAPKK